MILLVDDDEPNRSTFVRSFRKELVVHTASSGSEAIEALERETAHIIITDYTMPSMNGIELLGVIAVRWPKIHRLMVSGHSDLVELHNACRVGLVAELLPKPWRKAAMLAAVNRLMAGVS